MVDRTPGTYYFNFQFFAHEISVGKDFTNVRYPAIAIRFLDFPTLLIRASINKGGRLGLEVGKKCSFKMNSDDLSSCLVSKPAYVMFVDADPKNTSILASCTLSLSLFSRS
jgi:hypothetical protein